MDQGKVRGILAAAQQGDKMVLQDAIAKKNVGVVDEEATTPLMYAAASGREEILRLLLEKECLRSNLLEEDHTQEEEEEAESGTRRRGTRYIDQQNCYGWTALMQAASYGHTGSVVYLLQLGASLELLNSWGASVLVLASQGGHFGIVHTLLSRGAKVEMVQSVGEDVVSVTLTPLMAASQCGHVEVVRELVRSGANLEVKLMATRWTALMLACLNNRVSVVEVLLEAGANKECKDVRGKTAKDLAMVHGHKTVTVLLAGGKVAKNVSDAEFFDAVSKGNVEKVAEMLREKASLVQMEIKDGVTPLMLASNKGHTQVCVVLLSGKAEVNVKDKKYGWTALLHATHYKRYGVVELLCSYGADVNMKDNSGSSPYDVARMLGDVQMIQLIHSVTLKMLENKTTPTTTVTPTPITLSTPTDLPTPSITDTPSSPAQEVVEATHPSALPPASQPGPTKPIDLSELKSRLQNAYRVPAVGVAAAPSGLDRPSLLSPGNSRFPSKRNRTDASRSQPSPFPPSHSTSPAVSPASSSNTPGRSIGARTPRGSVPLFLQNNTKQGGLSDKGGPIKPTVSPLRMPSDRPPLRIGNPQRKNSGGNGDTPRGRSPRPRETGSSGSNHPFNFPSRVGLPSKGRPIAKNRSSVTSPGIGLPTTRASAARKQDLKSVLAGISLLQYLPLFEDQEVDEESFWTLGDQDLAEMGIRNAEDRSKIVTLISQRSTLESGRPKSLPFDGFVFQ